MVAYVALSLTAIRMVPVAIASLGSGLRAPTVAFLGWFGPRGLATILFGLLVLEEGTLPHGDLVESVAFCAAGASVFAHGLSAQPGARWYGRLVSARRSECAEEHVEVTEHTTR